VGLHCSFGHLKHKLWPKEGSEVKLAVWLLTIKNRELTQFTCLQRACKYHWKAPNKSYKFAFNDISIKGLFTKLLPSKVAGVPTWVILGLPLGSPGTKCHLDVSSVANHRVYCKEEGDGFPQVRVVVSLMCPCCPWLVVAPKVLQLCTNHFVWVLCRPVWVSEACQLFLVPSRSSNMPLYPSKYYEPSSVPRLFPLPLFLTWAHIWVLQGVGGASISVQYISNDHMVTIRMYLKVEINIKRTIIFHQVISLKWNNHLMAIRWGHRHGLYFKKSQCGI
jgi:hypothetical protein